MLRYGLSVDPLCPINWNHYLANNIIGMWRVVPGNTGYTGGLVWADMARNPGHNGTLVGTTVPLWKGSTLAGLGGAMLFDGLSQRVTMGGALSSSTKPFTLSMICQAASTTVGEADAFSSGDASQFGIKMGRKDSDWRIDVFAGGFDNIAALSGGVVANKWAHLAGAGDGTRLKFYVNGILAQDIASAFTSHPGSTNAIGREESFGGHYFDGLIGSVIVWQGMAMTASQIAALYVEEMQGCPNLLNWQRKVSRIQLIAAVGGVRVGSR